MRGLQAKHAPRRHGDDGVRDGDQALTSEIPAREGGRQVRAVRRGGVAAAAPEMARALILARKSVQALRDEFGETEDIATLDDIDAVLRKAGVIE